MRERLMPLELTGQETTTLVASVGIARVVVEHPELMEMLSGSEGRLVVDCACKILENHESFNSMKDKIGIGLRYMVEEKYL